MPTPTVRPVMARTWARTRAVEKPGNYAEQLQLIRVNYRISRIHWQQSQSGMQLQTFDGKFSTNFSNDDVTMYGFLSAIDYHDVAIKEAQLLHAAAAGSDEES